MTASPFIRPWTIAMFYFSRGALIFWLTAQELCGSRRGVSSVCISHVSASFSSSRLVTPPTIFPLYACLDWLPLSFSRYITIRHILWFLSCVYLIRTLCTPIHTPVQNPHPLKSLFYSYRRAPSFFAIFLPSLLYVEVLMNGDRFKALRAVRLCLST